MIDLHPRPYAAEIAASHVKCARSCSLSHVQRAMIANVVGSGPGQDRWSILALYMCWLIALRLLSLILEEVRGGGQGRENGRTDTPSPQSSVGKRVRRMRDVSLVIKRVTAGAAIETAWAIGVSAEPGLPLP